MNSYLDIGRAAAVGNGQRFQTDGGHIAGAQLQKSGGDGDLDIAFVDGQYRNIGEIGGAVLEADQRLVGNLQTDGRLVGDPGQVAAVVRQHILGPAGVADGEVDISGHILEGIAVDEGDRTLEGDTRQVCACYEGVASQVGHIFGNDDLGQTAIAKGLVTDILQGLGQFNKGHLAASVEGVLIDLGHAFLQIYAVDPAIGKGILADEGHGVGHRIVAVDAAGEGDQCGHVLVEQSAMIIIAEADILRIDQNIGQIQTIAEGADADAGGISGDLNAVDRATGKCPFADLFQRAGQSDLGQAGAIRDRIGFDGKQTLRKCQVLHVRRLESAATDLGHTAGQGNAVNVAAAVECISLDSGHACGDLVVALDAAGHAQQYGLVLVEQDALLVNAEVGVVGADLEGHQRVAACDDAITNGLHRIRQSQGLDGMEVSEGIAAKRGDAFADGDGFYIIGEIAPGRIAVKFQGTGTADDQVAGAVIDPGQVFTAGAAGHHIGCHRNGGQFVTVGGEGGCHHQSHAKQRDDQQGQ